MWQLLCRPVDAVEMYDPRADAWRPLRALAPARAYCAAATISGATARPVLSPTHLRIPSRSALPETHYIRLLVHSKRCNEYEMCQLT